MITRCNDFLPSEPWDYCKELLHTLSRNTNACDTKLFA